jgi:hypothetical protein
MRARTTAVLVPALAGLVLLTGCVLKRSKNAQVFVLEPVAARGAAAPADAPVAVVGVLKVTVPGWIDRPQMVTRAVGSQIVTDEFARWGEPIARGAQRVLAENLAALLPERRVVRAPFPPREPVEWRVDVAITELARQADGTVLLEALWAVLGKKGEVLVQRRSTHPATPSAAGAPGTAAGASDALAELSREIAGALRALPLPPAENEQTGK